MSNNLMKKVPDIKKSKSISLAIKGFARWLEILEIPITILVRVIVYLMVPFYLIFASIAVLLYFLLQGIYKGAFYGLRGLRKLAVWVWKGMLKPTQVLRRLMSFLFKGICILLVPPLFVFLLLIILLAKLFPYLYRWIAYGFTALRAIMIAVGENRGSQEEELIQKIEFTGFTYDPQQDIFYSVMDPWQRKFGYCRLYDEAAAVWGMIVDCEPVYFEYEGKKWLIEFWKGQYDLTTGCEIGVYTTEGPSLDIPGLFNGTFYSSGSEEDLLYASCRLMKKGKLLLTRKDKHWWLTGFKLGEFSRPSELVMEITISLKDMIMCNLFVEGLKKAGYSEKEILRSQDTVSFTFAKPKTRQPFTRLRFTDWLIQKKNKYMCRKYQKITGGCVTMQDKLAALQQKAPGLYSKIINVGRNIKLYNKCQKMNRYFN